MFCFATVQDLEFSQGTISSCNLPSSLAGLDLPHQVRQAQSKVLLLFIHEPLRGAGRELNGVRGMVKLSQGQRVTLPHSGAILREEVGGGGGGGEVVGKFPNRGSREEKKKVPNFTFIPSF